MGHLWWIWDSFLVVKKNWKLPVMFNHFKGSKSPKNGRTKKGLD